MAFLVKLIGHIIAAVRGPGGRTVWSALWVGFRTYRAALVVGLVVGWTACVAAEAFAAFFAVESALATFFAVTEALAASIVPGVYGSGVGGSITIVSALAGGLVGSVGAFLVLVVDTILLEPQQVVAELITGTIIALVITMAIYRVEPWMLERFGYRRMAWDERERLTPLITDAAIALGIDHAALPSIVIVDTVDTRAWATMRAVVLTRGLIEVLDDEELAGILAHEFAHWQAGHPVGERLLWAAALPLVLAQAVAQWFSGWRSGLVQVVAWLVFWPVNLTIRFVIAPLHGRYSRAYEYDADAAAAARRGAVPRGAAPGAHETLDHRGSPHRMGSGPDPQPSPDGPPRRTAGLAARGRAPGGGRHRLGHRTGPAAGRSGDLIGGTMRSCPWRTHEVRHEDTA